MITDNDYKVGIIGYGVVGRGIHRVLGKDVVAIFDPLADINHLTYSLNCGYDPLPDEEDKLPLAISENGNILQNINDAFQMKVNRALERMKTNKDQFKDLDLIVVCVMTKENGDGTCDTSIVQESIDWASRINPHGVILVKSAVVPSKIKYIAEAFGARVVVSPEYMGESKYFTPEWKYPHPERMESHTWQVFGGNKTDTSFCVDIFKRHMGVDCKFMQTNLMTAALCKYMENCFFATKVTFCNEFYSVAEKYGVDYNELRECWVADPRVGENHTLVFPKDRGFSGKCFPKDLKALIKDVESLGYSADLLKQVDQSNIKFRDINVSKA